MTILCLNEKTAEVTIESKPKKEPGFIYVRYNVKKMRYEIMNGTLGTSWFVNRHFGDKIFPYVGIYPYYGPDGEIIRGYNICPVEIDNLNVWKLNRKVLVMAFTQGNWVTIFRKNFEDPIKEKQTELFTEERE